jgi:hypothetical protein
MIAVLNGDNRQAPKGSTTTYLPEQLTRTLRKAADDTLSYDLTNTLK